MLKIAICDNEPLHLCYAAELVGRELSAQQAEIEGFLSLQALLGRYPPGPIRRILPSSIATWDGRHSFSKGCVPSKN